MPRKDRPVGYKQRCWKCERVRYSKSFPPEGGGLCSRCLARKEDPSVRSGYLGGVRPVEAGAYPMKTARERNRAHVVEYLQQHPCLDCGEARIAVLEFDHVRGVKFKNVSALVYSGSLLSLVKEEIGKCEVVCRNCRKIRTDTRRGSVKIL